MLVLATLSFAQTKISGTVACRPDQQQKIKIGNHPGHAFAINLGKCKWTKPLEIAGTQAKEDNATGFDEVNGNKSHGHGCQRRSHVRTQGSATMNGDLECRGHVEFHGRDQIKGKGTYKGKGAPDPSVTYEVGGDYELPKWRLAQSCRSPPQAGLKGSPSLGFAVREEDVGCLVAFPGFPGEACAKSNVI